MSINLGEILVDRIGLHREVNSADVNGGELGGSVDHVIPNQARRKSGRA